MPSTDFLARLEANLVEDKSSSITSVHLMTLSNPHFHSYKMCQWCDNVLFNYALQRLTQSF